jgi:hypothetical protein
MEKSPYLLIAFLCISLTACRKEAPVQAPDILSGDTFAVLQSVIFDQLCSTSGCHNSLSKAGGMDLSSSVSYQNLVGIRPMNSFARQDGLLRVHPGKPDSSFLFLKLEGRLRGGYGERMPLATSNPMTSNRREFVRQWIEAGAPLQGVVADARLLKDPVSQNDQFMAPPKPDRGVQLHLRPFMVDPQKEREVFVYQRLTTAETLYVSKVEITMREETI